MSYFPSISQNVVVDTANSVSTTLTAGSTWNSAGTGSSTLGVNAIQVVVKSDTAMTVYVDQGNANNSFQITDTYNYLPTVNFGITVQAVGAFVRVRVTNIASTTATFTVDTVLCPIVEALPRSLDEYGHLLVTTHGLKDEFDFKIKSGPMGTLDVDQPYRLVGTAFTGTAIDATFWTATQSGTGATTSAATPGIIIMTSGTSSGGFSNFTTVRQGRFIFAHPHKFRSIVRLTTATVANSTRRWGAYTAAGGPPVVPVDGFWFEQTGAGALTVNCRNNSGTITSVSSGSFNGDVSQYIVDTNAHAYEIIFFLGSATYFIDNVKVHTFTPTTTQLSSTFTLPVSFQSASSAISSSAVMEVWAGMILRLGRDAGSTIVKYQNGAATAVVAKSGPGRLHRVIYTRHPNGGVITLYDALTATNTFMIITPPNGIGPVSLECQIDFYTGLTYTTSTANQDVTLVFE